MAENWTADGYYIRKNDVIVAESSAGIWAADIVARLSAAEALAGAVQHSLESLDRIPLRHEEWYKITPDNTREMRTSLAQWRAPVVKDYLMAQPDPIQHSFTVPLPSGREIHDEMVALEKKRKERG